MVDSKADRTAAQTAADPNPINPVEEDVAPSKSTKSPAFQFYPRDFFASAKVDRMSMTERGIYITLLGRCWLDNGLSSDLDELAALARMKRAQFERIWNKGPLHLCFTERAGRLHHDRLDRERKIQADFSRKQKDKADKRWQSHGTAAAIPDTDTRHEPGNALRSLPRSLPQSASAERGRAPLHDTSHKKHAICGRVCLPGVLYSEFVQRRNHDGADKEIESWALEVLREWTDGRHRQSEPGDQFDFWRARYEERWPAVKADKRVPEWAR